MSGIRLVFSNADFSQHALPISKAKGTPNTTVTSRDGNYSIVFDAEGTAEISNTIINSASGQNGLFGTYGATVDVGITEFYPLYWDTSEWTSFYGTFMGLKYLTKVDLTHLNFEKSTDFSRMFDSCSDLTEIDFPGITSALKKTFVNTFGRCRKLANLTIGNIYNVKDIEGCFEHCWKLVNIDLSRMDLSVVTNISGAFSNCETLQTLNIKQFISANVTAYGIVFNGCTKLTTIYVDDATSAQWLITNCLSVNTGTSAYNWSYDSVNKVINRGSAI